MKNYDFNHREKLYLICGKNNFKKVVDAITLNTGSNANPSDKKAFRGLSKYVSLQKSNTYSNSVIVICGGIKLGTYSDTYMKDCLEKLEAIGDKLDTDFIIVRASGDNPALFDGEKIHSKHVIAVEDYSVIEVNGKKTLCVGGGVSYDREWVKKHTPSKYFKGEMTEYPSDDMDLSDVDFIISHFPTSFAFSTISSASQWTEIDDKLESDILREYNVMDRIYTMMNDSKKRFWYCTNSDKRTNTYNRVTFWGCKKHSLECIISGTLESLLLDELKVTFDGYPQFGGGLYEQIRYAEPNDLEPVYVDNVRAENLNNFFERAHQERGRGVTVEQLRGVNLGHMAEQIRDNHGRR